MCVTLPNYLGDWARYTQIQNAEYVIAQGGVVEMTCTLTSASPKEINIQHIIKILLNKLPIFFLLPFLKKSANQINFSMFLMAEI